ncbi:MAG: hypothetical protein OEV08_14030 [Nitrospira sp.]|nr:hypothetical protein [Nitrospira sp.]
MRAGLVQRVEQWRWSSAGPRGAERLMLTHGEWPMERPVDWGSEKWVNHDDVQEQIETVRRSVTKGQPFGSPLYGGSAQQFFQWSRLRQGSAAICSRAGLVYRQVRLEVRSAQYGCQ